VLPGCCSGAAQVLANSGCPAGEQWAPLLRHQPRLTGARRQACNVMVGEGVPDKGRMLQQRTTGVPEETVSFACSKE
jgi:hypothetical protein